MLRHAQTVLATLLVGAFALASGTGARARFAPPGTSVADIVAAAGWTYNGTQSLATTDAALANGRVLYLDGANRTTGIGLTAGRVAVFGVAPLSPNSDQAINLGSAAIRWSNLFAGGIRMGTSGALTWDSANPTLASCTSSTRTHGNSVSFQMDVGTSCTGISTVTVTLPAASNGWACEGRHITSGATRVLDQTGAISATSVTMTNFARTTGLAADFADGDDLAISCTAR